MFRTMDRSGITFALEGTTLKDRPLGPEESFREQFGGLVPLVPIPPGGTWSVPIVLQRFVLSPRPGRYRLRYTADIPYEVKTGGEPGHTACRGEVSFAVVPANPEGLKTALREYAARLDRPDYWERRAAVETLSVVEDPAVVPNLVHMLKLGLTDEAMKARGPVLQGRSCPARGRRALVGALGVLAEWKSKLDPQTIQALLTREDPRVREATQRYINAIEKKGNSSAFSAAASGAATALHILTLDKVRVHLR